MNAVFDVKQFGMPVTVEIQIHQDDILFLKETESHILYEIIRAPDPSSFGIEFSAATVGVAPRSISNNHVTTKKVDDPAEMKRQIADLKAELARAKLDLQNAALSSPQTSRSNSRQKIAMSSVKRLEKETVAPKQQERAPVSSAVSNSSRSSGSIPGLDVPANTPTKTSSAPPTQRPTLRSRVESEEKRKEEKRKEKSGEVGVLLPHLDQPIRTMTKKKQQVMLNVGMQPPDAPETVSTGGRRYKNMTSRKKSAADKSGHHLPPVPSNSPMKSSNL
jgi:hypothetical protein